MVKLFRQTCKKLKKYGPIIGLVSLILSIAFFVTSYYGNQYEYRLAESFREALSRSFEDFQRGGIAYPIRTPEKWAVNFEREATTEIVAQTSITVVVTRHNST